MHSRRVLVIEDDIDIRDAMVEALTDNGYDVLTATNGREALEKLRSASPLPCLILLDLMMPVMDGRDFRLEQLRHENLSPIPVIVVSANQESAQRATDLAAAGYLSKPLKLAALLDITKRYCA